MWRDALASFCDHALLILMIALAGFAGPVLIGIGLAAVLHIAAYPAATGPFVTPQNIGRTVDDAALPGVLAVQAGLGLIAWSIARGAITALALRGAGRPIYGGMSRWRALMAGMLFQSALLACAAVGVNTALRDTDFDLANTGQGSITFEGATRVIALRTLDVFIPNAGPTFQPFVPLGRTMMPAMRGPAQNYDQQLSDVYNGAAGGVVPSAPPAQPDSTPTLIFLASLGMLLLAEPLLRFQSVASLMCPAPGVVASLAHSISMGVKHFGLIALHTWIRRLVVTGVMAVFVIAPIVALEQAVTSPAVRALGIGPLMLQPHTLLACLAVIDGICAAFGAVYDARLYHALARD